ncbi:MAG: HEAT repeat domain-containing protein, partial [Leptolyngbyaceae cyanobacterium SL_5_9]|nr:HEAT repeat domain-containing protein [Leptolyngbyaceae cyanobacterium SL_5_9]NJO76917.1 HEAT repeat domain-containing protein [Leptolyngbyaceae cyanobacterium RM1_406_9]
MSTNRGIEVYLQELKSEDVESRQRAVLGLVQAKPEPEDVVPSLLQALKDPNNGVRGNAALALGRVGVASSEVVDALAALASEDNHSGVRLNAIGAIGKLQQVSPSH